VRDIVAAGREARFEAEREGIARLMTAEARAGDLVVVMGARDPSLSRFARDVLANIT